METYRNLYQLSQQLVSNIQARRFNTKTIEYFQGDRSVRQFYFVIHNTSMTKETNHGVS